MLKKITIKTKLIAGFSLIILLMITVSMITYTMSERYSDAAHTSEFILAKEIDHFKWAGHLKDTFINNDEAISVQTDAHQCGLGKWYYEFIETDGFANLPADLQKILLEIEQPHRELHESAAEIAEVYHQYHPGLEAQLLTRLNEHREWAGVVADKLLVNDYIDVQTDPEKCNFGKWINGDECTELMAKWPEFAALINKIRPVHEDIHATVLAMNSSNSTSQKNNIYTQETLPKLEVLSGFFHEVIDLETKNKDGFDQAETIMRTKTEPLLEEVLVVFDDALTEFDKWAASANQTMISGIVIGLITSLVIAVIVILILISGIINPINRVVFMIKDIAEGEGDLTKRLELDSKDEMGTLANWFNTFVDKVHKIIKQVKISAEQVSSASEQISASSEELASGAEEQQSQTSEVATSIEEMTATILDSSQNANQALDASKNAADVALKGGEVVDNTVTGMGRISDSVKTSANKIKELGERSEEIGKIIGVIDDIADQTNLLALNANIEAARAGDQGRGFAVVADEVRVLAERTTKATAEIADMIKGIQDGTSGAVESMNEGIQQVEEGVALAGNAGESLRQIIEVAQSVQGTINQIAVTAEEQSSGAEQISANVEGISTVTKQSASSAQQVASAADQLNRETSDLNNLVNQFKL